MEKWLILDLGHGKHKRSVPHLRVLESKEVLKKNQKDGVWQGTQDPNPKGPPSAQRWTWNNTKNSKVRDHKVYHSIVF